MAVYRVQSTIDGVFTSTDLVLEGKDIQLSYDGDHTYKSTDLFDLRDTITLQWVGRGLSFQEWTITLDVSKQKSDGSFAKSKSWSEDGQIPQGGSSGLHREIPLDSLE
jgi:hypothetical protein